MTRRQTEEKALSPRKEGQEAISSTKEKAKAFSPLFIRNASISWEKLSPDSYVRSIPALAGIEAVSFSSPVTFFVGENGSGKSTLLEAIAISYGFNPEGGTRNYRFSTYDSREELSSALTLSLGIRRARWGYFYRADSFLNVATQEEEYSRGPGGRPMHFHERSHGEGFLLLAQNSLREEGLYLLDEPEAALSPARQLTLLAQIHRCVQEGAQFLIATHSPILLGLPGAQILSFDASPLCPIAYEETDCYQVTELFINHREQLLHNLLEDAAGEEEAEEAADT